MQPRLDAGNAVLLSVNGELFNHRQLRNELKTLGHVVAEGADTLVWPALYRHHGARFLEYAAGQFAIALWDIAEQSLTLGRDRTGICPLFYAEAGGWLLWSSEIKGLLASRLVAARPDLLGLDGAFSLFAASRERTCFEGIKSLGPGEFLKAHNGYVTHQRYADLEFARSSGARDAAPRAPRSPRSEDALVSHAEGLLRRAVADRLEADTPIVNYLSGGLDSTLLLALSQAQAKGRAHAFTVSLDGAGPDESLAARHVAETLGVHHHVLTLDGARIQATLPDAVRAAEMPIFDMANPCALLLARQVRERGFKGVLTGEGADEALAGYFWHKSRVLTTPLERWCPTALRGMREALQSAIAPGVHVAALERHLGGPTPVQLDAFEAMHRAKSLFYSRDMHAQVANHDPFADFGFDWSKLREWQPLDRDLFWDYKVLLAGHLLLGKGDRAAMSSGVELRFPYLDEEFVHFCGQLAPEYKLRGGVGKWLLRAVAKRVLPKTLLRRPKTMFKAKSLCNLGPLPAYCEQLLSPESLKKAGYFCPEKVAHERALQRWLPAASPRRYAADAMFSALVTTQLWHHLYLGGALCDLAPFEVPEPQPLRAIA